MADIFSRPIQINAELSPQGTLTAELTPNETLDGELSIPRQVEVVGNYETLRNKPSINDVELTGNKSSSDLGLANATHTHTKSDITDFTHTHTKDEITDFTHTHTKNEITDFPTLAEVATSGDYDDLLNKPNLSEVATSGDYDDLSNKPNIPAKTSDLTNDSGFISQETDPTVPSWAKQETKPTYTASEVGALPDNTVIPSKTSDLTNDDGFISSPNVVYCTCDTGGGTAAKVATIVSGTLTSLNAGDQAIVKFTNTNTVANPTLKIGNTDAKAIKRYGTTAPSTTLATSWNAGNSFLFVYDGNYWQMVSWINTAYSEISVANITNGSSTSTGLVSGRRAKSAVEAFAPVKDVKVNGTSVVSSGEAQIPEIPTLISDLTNDSGFITHDEIFTDLGSVDTEQYEDDVYLFLNTLTEDGWYKFFWNNGDDYSYFVQVQSIESDGVTFVNQHYWGLEESPMAEYIRGLTVEDGEVVSDETTSYMTLETAYNIFAPKSHTHYRTDSKAVSVWDYCDGSQISMQNGSPILYTDILNQKQYLIETWQAIRQPTYKYQKVTDLIDCSVFYQRSGVYQSGVTTWGDWYKFSGTIFDPSGR